MVQSGAKTTPGQDPCLAPSAPPEPWLRRFLGGWFGLAAAAAVVLCHARRRRRRRRPELEGEEGRNLILGSKGLEANTELPLSRPGEGRALLPPGALPAGQRVSWAAQVVAWGRERAGGLGGMAVALGAIGPQGVKCPANRDPSHRKDGQPVAVRVII